MEGEEVSVENGPLGLAEFSEIRFVHRKAADDPNAKAVDQVVRAVELSRWARRGPMKCVPATNRMSGPRLGAANAPVKKRPGTLDSRWRSSTGTPPKSLRSPRKTARCSQGGSSRGESRYRR